MSNLYQVLFSTLSNRVKLLFINSFLGRLIYIFLELSILFIASVSMLFILVLVVFLISVCHWDVNEIIDTLLNRNQYHQFWCWWFCFYPADIVKSQAEAILGLFPFFLHTFFFSRKGGWVVLALNQMEVKGVHWHL